MPPNLRKKLATAVDQIRRRQPLLSSLWILAILLPTLTSAQQQTSPPPPPSPPPPRTSFQWISADPNIFRNTTQLLASRGFSSELHYPVTKDGYILTLVHVINPYISANRRTSSLRPILFQHGLFGNADDFLLAHEGRLVNGVYYEMPGFVATNCSTTVGTSGTNGTSLQPVSTSLMLTLATCGYDVWLSNYRGNRYSSRHVVLDQSDSEYWSFSVDEYALLDIPANIEYILSVTGRAELGYVGHSLGTSGMFQLLSARPQYSALIRPYIALAPVAHVANIRALLLQVAAHTTPLIDTLGLINAPFFGVNSGLLSWIDQAIASVICGNDLLRPLCTTFLFSLTGFDPVNTDDNIVTEAYGHFPDGTSSRVLAHLGQRVVRDDFNFFDYGPAKNLALYGTRQNPAYNLSAIDLRYMILVSGENDYLADPSDVDQLRSQLTVPIYRDFVVPDGNFNHVDFLFANNAGRVQNPQLLRWLNELYATDG